MRRMSFLISLLLLVPSCRSPNAYQKSDENYGYEGGYQRDQRGNLAGESAFMGSDSIPEAVSNKYALRHAAKFCREAFAPDLAPIV